MCVRMVHPELWSPSCQATKCIRALTRVSKEQRKPTAKGSPEQS